jgi:hypothetical protein
VSVEWSSNDGVQALAARNAVGMFLAPRPEGETPIASPGRPVRCMMQREPSPPDRARVIGALTRGALEPLLELADREGAPVGAERGRRVSGRSRAQRLSALLALAAALQVGPARADDAEGVSSSAARGAIAVDMAAGWLRRDWQGCDDPTRIRFAQGAIAFESHSSSALVWQVPTLNGPFEIDPALDWVRGCKPPPLSFFRRLAADQGTAMLADVSNFPYLVWRWRIEGEIDDRAIAGPDGRIRDGHDDFAAKLGVLVQGRGATDAHEIAYVWAHSLPVGTVIYQQKTVVPFVLKVRSPRLVLETGEGRGTWVEEVRDLRADFARLVPGEQAGRVLRVHLMTDSDDTRGQVAAAYADIRFVRSLASRTTPEETGSASPASGRRSPPRSP